MAPSASFSFFPTPPPRTTKHARPDRLMTADYAHGLEPRPIPVYNEIDDELPLEIHYCSSPVFNARHKNLRPVNASQKCHCVACGHIPNPNSFFPFIPTTVNFRPGNCSCSSLKSVFSTALDGYTLCMYNYDGTLHIPKLDDFNNSTSVVIECGDHCNCRSDAGHARCCRNRVVQNGVRSNMEIFKTDRRGWGLRTGECLPQFSFVCEYVGEYRTSAEFSRKENCFKDGSDKLDYCYDLSELFIQTKAAEKRMPDEDVPTITWVIDSSTSGNVSRFINHSCRPNCMCIHVFYDHNDERFPHIAIFTTRKIEAGEELTISYGDHYWERGDRHCLCGSSRCCSKKRRRPS